MSDKPSKQDFDSYTAFLRSGRKCDYLTILLYGYSDEDESYWKRFREGLEKIAVEGKHVGPYEVIVARHLDEDGKKPHAHVYLRAPKQGWSHCKALQEAFYLSTGFMPSHDEETALYRFIRAVDGKYIRYLCHGDSPHKKQYDSDIILASPDFVEEVQRETEKARAEAKKRQRKLDELSAVDFMKWFYNLEGMTDFSDIVSAAYAESPAIVEYISKNTYFVNSLLKSQHKRKEQKERDETAEYMLELRRENYKLKQTIAEMTEVFGEMPKEFTEGRTKNAEN